MTDIIPDLEKYEYPQPAETNEDKDTVQDRPGPYMPVLRYFIYVVDELGDAGIVVRRYYADYETAQRAYKNLTHAEYEILANPYKYGLIPGDINGPRTTEAKVTHVWQETNRSSPFTSASDRFPFGAKTPEGKFFSGKLLWIDVGKLEAHGAKLISAKELVAVLEEYRREYPHLAKRINNTIYAIEKFEGEVLIQGKAHPKAMIRPSEYFMSRAGRCVGVLSFALTGYALGVATNQSIEMRSIKPLAAEATRQVGGWMGFAIGFKLGSGTGSAVGAFGGPAAPATVPAGALIGGFIGGVIGYFAGDAAADVIHPN